VNNFYQYNNNLASGGQPTIDEFNELKNNGFDAVLNISPSNTRNYLKNEAEIVENLKMKYVHFPIDCSNLQAYHYQTFKGILNGLGDFKIFVHCGANIKSSNLIHIYNVLENKIDERESLETLLKIQNPEPKWFEYFKSCGLNEK